MDQMWYQALRQGSPKFTPRHFVDADLTAASCRAGVAKDTGCR